MSFRSGDLKRDNRSQLTLSDLTEGQKIDGRVKRVEDYGIFIEVEGSKISGLCHKSEVSSVSIPYQPKPIFLQLSDNKDADVTLALRSFREGDKVKAVVLSIDTEKRRISFGLKPSYFEEKDFEQDDEPDEVADDEAPRGSSPEFGVIEGSDDGDEGEGEGEDGSDDEVGSGEESAEESESEEEGMDVDFTLDLQRPAGGSASSAPNAPADTLRVDGGFQWSAPDLAEDVEMGSEEDSDDDDGQDSKKKKKRKEIEQDLTADMHTKMPESNADFERLLLGSPNSSYLWVQYMSFQLQISEIDKAREIAKRALKTINFREEQEKLNVWIALLNLENVYGTDESLEATFKDAARHNDSKTIHLRLAEIFEQSDKPEVNKPLFTRGIKQH